MRPIASLLAVVAFTLAAGAAQASDNLLTNGSFEQPAEGYGYYYPTYDASLSTNGWYYSGGVALINKDNGNNWVPPSNVDGDQFVGLQTTGDLYQVFNVGTAAAFTLSWLDAGRPDSSYYGGDQTYEVIVDSVTRGSFSTTSGGDFTQESLDLGQLAAGSHTLEFLGTDTAGGDNTAYLDRVSVTESAPVAPGAVPEPTTWAMLMLGVALTGFAARHRRQGLTLAAV